MPQLIDRTWRLQAFTDYGAVPRIEWLRETRKVYEDGDHKQVANSIVARSLADIAAQPIPGGAIQLGNAYTATPPTCTGYVTVKDSTGTVYKLLCST